MWCRVVFLLHYSIVIFCSEELDDIENCLNNRPAERLERLRQLSQGLSSREVMISPVELETAKLEGKWLELERQARNRIRSLEACIAEAQEWECKILGVQVSWLLLL